MGGEEKLLYSASISTLRPFGEEEEEERTERKPPDPRLPILCLHTIGALFSQLKVCDPFARAITARIVDHHKRIILAFLQQVYMAAGL